jgi:prepilin-type N-terminal cleavage/methylation domain-containing protein
MRKSARKGISLLEVLLATAILAILTGLATPYLLGTKEKILLETEQEKIANVLREGRQKAIAAYEGYGYQIRFNPPREVILQPETDHQLIAVNQQVEITIANPEEINFARLTGQPDSSFNLTLESRRFRCQVNLSPEGIITTTKPERR